MILISQGVTWSATVATGFTFLCASKLSATADSRLVSTSQRTGGWHDRQPVFFMVFHASMALCRSIRRRVGGQVGLGTWPENLTFTLLTVLNQR